VKSASESLSSRAQPNQMFQSSQRWPDKESDISLSVLLWFANGENWSIRLENVFWTQYRTPTMSNFEKTCFFSENCCDSHCLASYQSTKAQLGSIQLLWYVNMFNRSIYSPCMSENQRKQLGNHWKLSFHGLNKLVQKRKKSGQKRKFHVPDTSPEPVETLWNYLNVVQLNLLKRTPKVLCTLQVWDSCIYIPCLHMPPFILHDLKSHIPVLHYKKGYIALRKYAPFSISKRLWFTKPYSIIMHLV